jgi:hypothetical protein
LQRANIVSIQLATKQAAPFWRDTWLIVKATPGKPCSGCVIAEATSQINQAVKNGLCIYNSRPSFASDARAFSGLIA